MLTAADVPAPRGARGRRRAVATVGAGHALAAAGRRPRAVPSRRARSTCWWCVAAPLTDAGLAGALLTAVEAKAQALADARVPARNAGGWATGTATDSDLRRLPAGRRGARSPGPATRTGADLARAVHAAVLAGALAEREERAGQRSAGVAPRSRRSL